MSRLLLLAMIVLGLLFAACTDEEGNIVASDVDTFDSNDACEDIDVFESDRDADETVDIANTEDDTGADEDSDPCIDFVPDDCREGESYCTGFNTVKTCVSDQCGLHFVSTVCADGFGCVSGACTEGTCSDECTPGTEKDGKSCDYWDVRKKKWISTHQDDNLHDRFEEYLRWLHRDMLPFGGVCNADYTDEQHTQLVANSRTLDSALWTGTYLASEALRYMTDGSVSARENMKHTIETLHLFLTVSGSPGMLSRYAFKSADRSTKQGQLIADDMQCSDLRVFCNIEHEGVQYDYKGNVSRDQYQGVMLGYSLAYDALPAEDEEYRALIRDDVVTLAETLMSKQHLEITLTYDNIPVDVPGGIDARFVVLAPREMKDGKVTLNYCSKESDTCKNRIRGFQEFIPDMKIFLRQVQGLNWIPQSIPRASSAIMLANIFRVALQVTDGVEGYEDKHNAFTSFYFGNNDGWGNVNDWLNSAKQWKFTNKCGSKYYGINISMEPLYNLLRLEDNAVVKDAFYSVLANNIWEQTVKQHKNCFFAYIYASHTVPTNSAVIASATEQFRGFATAPHAYYPVDLMDNPKYEPHSEECTNQTTVATCVDVSDRVPADFIWQKSPFDLVATGDPRRVFPGIDYLIVYQMGRYYGYIDDQSEGRCFRYREQ